MSDSHDLLPEERDEQNSQLITSLRRSYDTKNEDRQSLTRIRERLLQISAGSLPREEQMPIVPLPTQSHRKGKTNMQLIHNPFAEGKTWQQRMGTIAAVILVLVLVGSMATLFYIRSHQSDLGNPALSPGWKQVALFSGTGSKTLTHLNIHLTQLWGYSVGCIGDAEFQIELVEVGNEISSGCTTKNPATFPLEPQSFQLGNTVNPSNLTLNTVKITAPSDLRWYLRLANTDASAMPFMDTLTASKYGWVSYSGFGGDRSGGGYVDRSPTEAVKTIGLLMVCDRKGSIQLDFNAPYMGTNVPNMGTQVFACSTDTKLYIVHFPQDVQLQNVQVHVFGVGHWFIETVRCTNEKACSSLPREP